MSDLNPGRRVPASPGRIALEHSEKRFPSDGCVQEPGEFSGAEVAGLQGKRLPRGVTQALEYDDVAGGWEREPRGGFVFTVEHFGEEHFGAGGKAAAGHLLRITHQFVEVNLWGRDKGSNAAAALNDSFAFQRGQSVTRGHQADLMNFGQVALGGDRVAGMQLSCVDALADGALNSLVGGQAVAVLGRHPLSHSSTLLIRWHPDAP